MTQIRPMLACADISKLRFPLLASPKIDGIRAMVINGVVMSRSMKPIPHTRVQELFGLPAYEGYDGELCVGAPNAPDLMQKTMAVMRRDGEIDVTYHVFDRWDQPKIPYEYRMSALRNGPSVQALPQTWVQSQAELDAFEADCLSQGFEGVMVRDPSSYYKYGRATARSGEICKVKRFSSAEATVVGCAERMHNDNEAFADELGRTKRSTHQGSMRGAGDLGALVCRTAEGVEFCIGTGFTAAQRQELWGGPSLVGQLVTYRHFEASGVKEAPRFPVFLGLRSPLDMDP